jgi:hypothetical protein
VENARKETGRERVHQKLEGYFIYEADVQSFDDCARKQQENVLHLEEPFFAVPHWLRNAFIPV